MLMMSIAIFAKGETKIVVYTTAPQMHCAGCENKIKGNLKFVKGIKKIETSVPDQTVTITFDPAKTTTEKIEAGFKDLGYTVKKLSETVVVKKAKKPADVDGETGATQK